MRAVLDGSVHGGTPLQAAHQRRLRVQNTAGWGQTEHSSTQLPLQVSMPHSAKALHLPSAAHLPANPRCITVIAI